MATQVQNEKELAKAIQQDSIEIEITDPKTGKRVLRIKATGKIAWGVAFGALAIGVAALLIPSPDPATKGAVPLLGGGAAAAILGTATPVAIAIAVAAGGVGVLNKLRAYKVSTLPNGHVLLSKK
ncbi:MAG: hypothetical protein MJ016_05440 [Victivallaceae bacterium]|nr:hypothetical protein [Victivallaceae bacterium]